MDAKIMQRPMNMGSFPMLPRPVVIPLGLNALYTACRHIYPDQPNPLQVTALVKYWLGGPDPLDYISMYSNPGNPASDIPPHWHYVSFGLSDLHGDGRVHEISGGGTPSGFGFELTFRLKKEPDESAPPTWPAAIMQALAKYVFSSENTLCSGDHVSWHCPLDNSESRIQHMLMCEDPQLGTVPTPFGPVTFLQIVGICAEELQAAQGWNGPGIIELLKSVKGAGGPWLITDMRRGETIFELDSTVQEAVDEGVLTDGSNLSGVSAKCAWFEKKPPGFNSQGDAEESDREDSCLPEISVLESEQIKATLKKGLLNTKPVLPQIRPTSSNKQYGMSAAADQNEDSRKDSYDSNMNSEVEPAELLQTKYLDSVHLQFNLEAGSILPLALRGRLKHGRHFTFKCIVGKVAITLVPTNVAGSLADREHPFAALGQWLQVLLTDEEIDVILKDLNEIAELDAISLPKTFEWKEKKFSITLMHEDWQ